MASNMSETMEECWNDDAIRFVFKYLNEKELHNAYLVCKTWWKIGKSVNKERGPICRTMIRRKTEKQLKFPARIRTMIEYLVKNPSFCMFMSNDIEKYDTLERCYCTQLPMNCYSIWIENLSSENKFFTLSTAIFPNITHIQVENFTFHCKYSPKGFYCAEIHRSYGIHFLRICNLKLYFDKFFQTECPPKYCLFLWCRRSRLNVVKNIIKNVAKWYTNSQVVIWGGVADSLYVCNKEINIYICRNATDIVFLFTKARQMEVKSLVLDQSCVIRKLIARKFRVLSENTTLKEHSIAFMYTSYSRFNKCYKLESLLFKQYFPSVKLVHTVGSEPLGASGVNELFIRMQLPTFEGYCMHTTLMLITFN